MWLRYNFSKEKSLSHRSTSKPVYQSTTHHSPLYYYTTLHSPLTISPLTTHDLLLTAIRPLNYATDRLTFFSFLHRPKKKQKRLGLFLCLRKLQKRLPHAKQTVSLVLCSIILSSPLFCFPNSIKSRPFFFVSRNLSLQGCQFEWFSIENCIEKCFEVRCLIEFSIQISLFSKVKFTCLPRNAGRLELTCIQTYQSWVFTVHHSLFNILYSVSTTHH